LAASPAKAVGETTIGTAILGILGNGFYIVLGMFTYFLFSISAFLVQFAAALLEFTFSIEKFTDVSVVTYGWQICRDLCNIGFVLIMLVMAFDSVLQLNKYPIKQLLPKLIIAALLINFSLVFCGMIIDFSQIVTHYFYEAAKGDNTAGLSGQLAGALNLQSVFKEPVKDWGQQLRDETGNITPLILGIIFNTVIMLVAAFSMAAAAIFFITRIVMLWLLMIFSPFAWISMIAPGIPKLGGYWGRWWTDFIKWSLFAPIYMFFIYLAIMIAASGPMNFSPKDTAVVNQSNLLTGSLGFLSSGFGSVLQYIAIIIILIGGLKTAQETGAVGATTIKGWGKKATDWGKKKFVVDPAKRAYNRADGFANKASSWLLSGTVLSDTKWGKLAMGRQKARETEQKQKNIQIQKQSDGSRAYGRLLGSMSEQDILNEVKNAGGMKKLMAAEEANKRGFLAKASCDTATAKSALETFKKMDPITFKKEIDNLKEIRPDAILELDKDGNAKKEQSKAVLDDLKSTIKDSMTSGNFNKIKGNVLAGENGAQIMAATQEMITDNIISQGDLNKSYASWFKQTKDAAEKAMKANPNWSDNFDDKNNIAAREMHASSTGKITDSFTEKYNQYSPEAAYGLKEGINKKALRSYAQGMSSTEIGSVPLSYARAIEEEKDGKKVIRYETTNNSESLRLIGENILASQLGSIRNELNGAQKVVIMEGINRSNNDLAKDFINNNPAWAKHLQKTMEKVGSTLKNTGREQVDILKSQDEKLKKISNQPNEK